MTNLTEYAQKELELAGLFDPTSDYDGMLGTAVLDIIKLFAGQGHSGMSAAMVTELATKLMRYEPLTPLTYGPEEWIDQSEASGRPCWQNNRDFKVFSYDGGLTHERLSDSKEPVETYDAAYSLAEAIRLTVEYVGNDMLPAQEGWSWFDALNRYDPEMVRPFVEKPIHFAPRSERWSTSEYPKEHPNAGLEHDPEYAREITGVIVGNDIPDCPDCVQGKHKNCLGTSWNRTLDKLDTCPCEGRDHTKE